MIKNTLKTLLFFSFLFPAIFFSSCQKEIDIDPDNPPPIPDELKDSTLLIKSIKLNTLDPISGLPDGGDTIKEDYFYDTLNRKIIITLDQAASNQYITEAGFEHRYDANGLLIHVLYKYKNGYTPEADDPVSVELEYDAAKIIQKITLNYFNGNNRSILFRKTSLAGGGYSLGWGEPTIILIGGGQDTVSKTAVFDNTGKCLVAEFSFSYNTALGGEDAYTQVIYRDSLFYDAKGSVTKIVETYIDTLSHTNTSFVGGEFISRQTKGDQLFNMRQTLLNGIANIPFGEDMFHGSISGVLSYFADGYEPLEYSRYPFQSAKVFNSQTNQYDNFTAVSEFDNKDRLIKFKGFLNDTELIPYQYEITYYK